MHRSGTQAQYPGTVTQLNESSGRGNIDFGFAGRQYHQGLCPYQFISKIFDTFAKHRTPLCLLVSSNQDVSVAIDNSERLCKILAELEQYAKILMEDRMSIVSVVGNMRWQYAGVEAQIIEALADIPLRMISYGSNDSDVAFVIKTEDKKRALQALSNKLFEPETDKVTG